MKVSNIREMRNPESAIVQLLSELHKRGPIDPNILEEFAYYKEWFPTVFQHYEEIVITALGLFYKLDRPSTIYSLVFSSLGDAYRRLYGRALTPVQASIRAAIESKDVVSISAPTSSGKSFSIRSYIRTLEGDTVIVVPSRALIAEYIAVMRQSFGNNKTVMLSPFVDDVFSNRNPRRIFILTPERARDLFRSDLDIDPVLFFFDEAQTADEKSRAVIFDALVRRIRQRYPHSKLIFAHPSVKNPDAQFSKHAIVSDSSYSRYYGHGAVGRICVFQHKNGNCYYFSPHEETPHVLKNCVKFEGSFSRFAFDERKSILVYVSKNSIYNGTFVEPFRELISQFDPLTDNNALRLIEQIAGLIGADDTEHKSYMVDLMKRGVVIHHGSVPLEVRYLIEEFIRTKNSRICFATSTLAQGVNMPFDIVWLESMRFLGDDDRWASLSFKNLIGRAGRLSENAEFDFGYVFTKSPKLFSKRMQDEFALRSESILDSDIGDDLEDQRELIEAIRHDQFDDNMNAPMPRVKRLSTPSVLWAVQRVLELTYGRDGPEEPPDLSGAHMKPTRDAIKEELRLIWQAAIDRPMEEGEKSVFDQAIFILIQMMQGRSFREIASLRYAHISRKDTQGKGNVRFVQKAENLPNKKLKKPFPVVPYKIPAGSVSYDALVFDTYDYIDQVISFSLSDSFVVALKSYRQAFGDERADFLIDLLWYGTNDPMHIMLIRYGFPPESVKDVSKYVEHIDRSDIKFSETIENAPNHIRRLVAWYLP